MTVRNTTNGKKFILDRCKPIREINDLWYYRTGTGNIVRENANGTWDEVPLSTVEANILLLPYDLAKELFPANAALVETI